MLVRQRPAGKFVNNPGGEGIDRHLTGVETLAFQARITDLQKLPRAREGLVDALDEQVLISATLDAPRAGKALPWCWFLRGSRSCCRRHCLTSLVSGTLHRIREPFQLRPDAIQPSCTEVSGRVDLVA